MSDLSSLRLTLIGCGKMGGAMLAGWLARGLKPERTLVVDPYEGALEGFPPEISRLEGPEDLPADPAPDVLVVAVKPQQMAALLPTLMPFARAGTTFLSIAAGVTIATFREALGRDASVVRAMPNTPAAIGRGITALVPGPGVEAETSALCAELLSSVGAVERLEDESLIDAVTALSGGGPAYVFLLAETLAKAGAHSGLPPEVAERLARHTVAGAGALLDASDEPAATLRENVTSPGGTTLEALKVLMAEDGVQPLFDRAIAAATRRSRELAG